MEKGRVIYIDVHGGEVIFDGEDGPTVYAHVKEPDGKEYEENLLGSILAHSPGRWIPAPGWRLPPGRNPDEVEILGEDKKPILYASRLGGRVKLEYEYFSDSSDGSDLQVTYTIFPSGYELINQKYGIKKRLDIMSLLQFLSDNGRGSEFKDDLMYGEIKSERWYWRS
jgi:hypothetical protein